MTNQELIRVLSEKLSIRERYGDIKPILVNDKINYEIDEVIASTRTCYRTLHGLEDSFWLRLKFLFTGRA